MGVVLGAWVVAVAEVSVRPQPLPAATLGEGLPDLGAQLGRGGRAAIGDASRLERS